MVTASKQHAGSPRRRPQKAAKARAPRTQPPKQSANKPAARPPAAKRPATASKHPAGAGKKPRDTERSAPQLAEVDAEVLEFIAAIDEFKQRHGRPFPSWSEVLLVLRQLGYRRDAAPAPAR